MAHTMERERKLDLGGRESIYQPEDTSLIYPYQPKFKSFAEERQHLKERLVAACRAFALEKFDYGFAGHLTVRDPEHRNRYWTNPMAVHFDQVKVSNLILADHEGNVLEGKHALNRAGFVLHAAVHEKVAYMHPRCGNAPGPCGILSLQIHPVLSRNAVMDEKIEHCQHVCGNTRAPAGRPRAIIYLQICSVLSEKV